MHDRTIMVLIMVSKGSIDSNGSNGTTTTNGNGTSNQGTDGELNWNGGYQMY